MSRATTPTESIFTICVVARSRLASEYVLEILSKDCTFRPILFGDFLEQALEPEVLTFVIEASSLTLPLGECMRRLRLRYARARYLVIDHERRKEDVVHMLSLGIHGYLGDNTAARQLVPAVHAVLSDEVWVSSEVLQAYMKFTSPANNQRLGSPQATTPRETQVLELAERGFGNKEIAKMLRVQESTIKYHIANIFGKLRIVSRRDLLVHDHSMDVWNRILPDTQAGAI